MGVITAPVRGSGSWPAWMALVEKPRMEQRYAGHVRRRRRVRATSQISIWPEGVRRFARGRPLRPKRCSTGGSEGGPAVSAAEIVAVVGAVVLVLARWAPARARRPVAMTALAVVVLATGVLVVTGLRWQLVPVLVGAALVVPFAFGRRRARWWLAAPGSALCLVLVALGPLAAWGFPVPRFPAPTGPFAVG